MPDLKEALTRYVEEQTPSTPPPFERVDIRARHRRRRRTAAVAAVPVLLAATFAGVQLVRDPAPSQPGPQARSGTQSTSPRPGQGPISPGLSSASCVEQYDRATLKNRAFAFDGTVSRLVPMPLPADGSVALPGYSAVTFNVHEWFRGGDQATVTVDMMSPQSAGAVSSVEGLAYGVGTRLLVSGEPRYGGSPLIAPIAWGCGFTRIYDRSTAETWR